MCVRLKFMSLSPLGLVGLDFAVLAIDDPEAVGGLKCAPEKAARASLAPPFVFRLVLLGFALGLGQQLLTFLGPRLGPLDAFAPFEISFAVDPCLETDGACAEGWGGPDHEVPVLARFKRTDSVIYPQLSGRIQRDKIQCICRFGVAVLDRLGRLEIHTAREVG